MNTEHLELTYSCRFEVTRYENQPADVCLEYIEHACDHYSSDTTTSITISADDACKIMAFLTAAFWPNNKVSDGSEPFAAPLG